MPRPVFIDFDRGVEQLPVASIDGPRTWPATLALFEAIAANVGGYQTVVIDTADPLEEIATEYLCAKAKKETLADFGWGAGYDALAGEWRVLLSLLDRIRAQGAMVVLLAHSVVRTATDPAVGSYDAHQPALQKKTWAATHRWADLIIFAAHDAAKLAGEERRAILTGERVAHVTSGTGFVAKNRYAMPPKMTLYWPVISAAMASDAGDLRGQIITAAGEVHAAKAAEYIASAGEDLGKLRAILSAIKERTK